MPLNSFYSNLTKNRVDVYNSAFLLKESEKEKFSFLYLALQDLTSSFYPLIQVIEVTLRNSINNKLIEVYGKEYWYEDLYLNEQTQRHFDIARERANGRTHDHFVCELTFGAWVNLLHKENRGGVDTAFLKTLSSSEIEKIEKIEKFWGTHLDSIFKGRDGVSIKELHERLKDINTYRNRFSHYEPLWKPTGKQSFSMSKSPMFQSMSRFDLACMFLNDKFEKCLAVLKLCCPQTHLHVESQFKASFSEKMKFYQGQWNTQNKKK